MKLILILTISLLVFSGCRNVNMLTRIPADSANFTYDRVENTAVMTERKTGRSVVLTKREVKQLNKDRPDVVDFRAQLIFTLRNVD